MANSIVQIPYGLKHHDLKLEPGTGGDSLANMLKAMQEMPDATVERVFRATTVLFTARAGSFHACLETALIWECG